MVGLEGLAIGLQTIEYEDIEAYLTTFERMMQVEEARWVFQLAPQLAGKAQQAYDALSAEARGGEGGNTPTIWHQ